MTTLRAGPDGFDMIRDLDFSDYPDATPSTANQRKVAFDVNGFAVQVNGEGFSYGGPNEFPADGLIHSVKVRLAGTPVVSITEASLDVSDMRDAIATNHPEIIMAALFGGDDKIMGGRDGANNLAGLGGNDTITGGEKDDTLGGGTGMDLLVGGRRQDILVGGSDDDTFRFYDTGDSYRLRPDIIVDLTTTDTIDLRPIDANINKDGNQAFKIVDSFSNKAGEMTLTFDPGPQYTRVYLDVDGDGKADMGIFLGGVGGIDHSGFTNFVF